MQRSTNFPFFDPDVGNEEVGFGRSREGKSTKVVFLDFINTDTGGKACGCLSKEDLLHLLKLIEETN